MNYYKRPLWKSRFFYLLIIILLSGVGFVYRSITAPTKMESTATGAQNLVDPIILSEKTTPKIHEIDGKATLTKRLTGVEAALKQGDLLSVAGDTISMQGDSRMTIWFGNSGFIRLDKNARIQILETENDTITIRHIAGNVYHHIQKNSINYAVEVENARIATGEGIFTTHLNENPEILDLYQLKNTADLNITKDMIPISAFTIKQGTHTRLYRNKITKTPVFDQIDTKKILQENEWLQFNLKKNTETGLSFGILSSAELPKDIILNGDFDKKNIRLTWKLTDGSAPHGFRVLMSKDGKEPTYPDYTNHYLTNPDARGDYWKNIEKGEYIFRVGIYDGKGEILLYSNSITMNTEDQTNFSSINLYTKTNESDIKLTWDLPPIDGIEAFYIISSTSQTPTYPTDPYQKIEADKRSFTWKNLDMQKTYRFRICAMIKNTCASYSEVNTVTFGANTNLGEIKLNAYTQNTSVELSWSTKNLSADHIGYRILLSEQNTPTLSSSIVRTIDSRGTSSYTWTELSAGKNFYMAICEYIGTDRCGIYSNTVQITTPPKAPEQPMTTQNEGTIKTSAYYAWNKIHISWEANNIQGVDGYYVILSTEQSSTHPEAPYHIIPLGTNFDSWSVEDDKTYYAYTCAHLNGQCLITSNTLTIKTTP